jgi:hypothetical protein
MSSPKTVDLLAPSRQIFKLLTGKFIAQAVSVAATLGIADRLADVPLTVEQLATATSTHRDSLYRLLRALAGQGIFAETEDGLFTLTPLAQCLRGDTPDSMRNMARMFGLPLFWQSWGEMLHTVKTGEAGLKKAFGITEIFEYFSQHPDVAEIFDGAMNDSSCNHGPGIAAAYDFGKFRKIVDTGGGRGMLLISILSRYPGPRGVVFDLPHVIPGAQEAIATAGLSDRCEAVPGSFFESVPPGADAYVMRSITHGFRDERAQVILRNIRHAIQPQGRLLLVDFVVPASNEPSLGKLVDLQMLVMSSFGGRERTASEFQELLGSTGFRLVGIHLAPSQQSIVEAVPA